MKCQCASVEELLNQSSPVGSIKLHMHSVGVVPLFICYFKKENWHWTGATFEEIKAPSGLTLLINNVGTVLTSLVTFTWDLSCSSSEDNVLGYLDGCSGRCFFIFKCFFCYYKKKEKKKKMLFSWTVCWKLLLYEHQHPISF